VIILDEHGKQFSSLDFSNKLSSLVGGGNSNLVFIIGGPRGLDDSILKLSNLKLSFSAFTFTHQMVRVFLWEQIYRAMMITSGRQYHY
jgi:23S rRNA (pseudouridine1915-N3)-methyltransferase